MTGGDSERRGTRASAAESVCVRVRGGQTAGGRDGRRPPHLYSPLVNRGSSFGCLVEVAETLILTLVIFFVIQNFIAQPYQVQQKSMERTLEPGQYVLVDKLTPRWDSYSRGDVVVFNPPPAWTKGPDAVHQARDRPPGRRGHGQGRRPRVRQRDAARRAVHVHERGGRPRADDQRARRPATGSCPAGELFVMGDHRAASADSRVFGPIAISNVIGRAFLRYWPLSHLRHHQHPVVPRRRAGARTAPELQSTAP